MSREKQEEKEGEPISRRKYLSTAGGLAVAAVAGWGVAGYLASTAPAPSAPSTVTQTVTQTVERTVTGPAPATTPAKPPLSKGPITVSTVAESRCTVIQKMLSEFTDKTGVQVNYLINPYDTIREKQMMELTGKTGAMDIVQMDLIWTGAYVGGDFLEPLDDYIKNTAEFAAGGPNDINDYPPAILDGYGRYHPVSTTTLYGVPFLAAAMGFFYRTDIFNKYGLQVPDTWDDVYKTGKTLADKFKADGVKDTYPLVFGGIKNENTLCVYVDFLGSFGGKIYDESTFHATLSSKEAIAALEFETKLGKEITVPGFTEFTYDGVASALASGRAAMGIQWLNFAPAMRDPTVTKLTDDQWNCKVMPGVMQPDGSIRRSPCLGGWSMGIPNASKYKQEAWEFIKWVTSKPMEKTVALAGGGASCRLSTLQDAELSAKFKEFKAFMDTLPLVMPRPNLPQWTEMSDALQGAVSAALTGAQSPADALGEANAKVEVILAPYRK